MKIKKTSVAVIGAGPAGLSCAAEILKRGLDVVILDENPRPGGQLFKQIHKFFGSTKHQAGVRGFEIGERLLDEVNRYGGEIKLDCPVYGIFDSLASLNPEDEGVGYQIGYIDNKEGSEKILEAKKILIATGASENSLYFPGSTLPGVMSAGAAQTMANIDRVLPGKRIVMVGSGNVGLIVSYQLMQAGANIEAVVEASSDIGGYRVHLDKLKRAGVPIYTSHTVVKATGRDRVEEVCIEPVANSNKTKRIKADTLCLAVGLSPQVDLCRLVGCEFGNENLETTKQGIFVAGDGSGVEEASTAMEEGRLAGINILKSLKMISNEDYQKSKKNIQMSLDELRKVPSDSKTDNMIIIDEQHTNHFQDKFKREGPRACIECYEKIPCNPCVSACPFGAISIEPSIIDLPELKVEKCTGCASCVHACPGLAIFVVDENYSDDGALVTMPYEYLPLPRKGQQVACLDREGNCITDGQVKKVQLKPEYNKTAVITVIIPKKYVYEVRNIASKYDGWENDSYMDKSCSESENSCSKEVVLEDDVFLCRCEEITEKEVEDAILDGARSIKGIKNRTSAGMGLCQGRTCSNLITKKLNKYLDLKDSKEILPDKKRMPIRPVKINNFLNE
ncbi:FAD-dependent oxidoreductase [Natranaerofaba carboxydovora]|uniref:FAD-dependent oxidoreductase n=1 Tax=Natranaerofaba carboxydovora TaxID=2742683 RepID=UPI001F146BD8|nr:FAD-dependent oxidoreductase [Natranaerofaba carboxydovora]UMZ74896.1 Hydrogen cyanide synthase subunit HcnB [Natranaerofaba carboxydovora]